MRRRGKVHKLLETEGKFANVRGLLPGRFCEKKLLQQETLETAEEYS